MAASQLNFDPGKIRVLIIDDHDQIRKAIKRIVQGIGVNNVHEATDGAKGIELFISQHPTLIICDLAMPHMDGFAVLDTIRQLTIGADVPVLVVTGEASKEDIVKAIDLGANDYLIKPFQSTELEKKIAKLVDAYLNPDQHLQLIRKTERFLLQGKTKEASEALSAANQLDLKNLRGRFLEAYILEQQHRDSDSIAILASILGEQPNYYRASALLANIALRNGLRNEAIRHMNDEVKFNSKQPNRLVQLGKLMMEQGSLDQASDLFRRALLIEPRHREALLAMGHVQVKLGKTDKGIYYFKRLRRNYPDSRDALEAVVDTCNKISDLRQAEYYLKDERSEHPENHDATVLLARVYFIQEKLDEAIQVAADLTQNGQSDEAALILALAEIKNKNFQKALSALEQISSGASLAYACRLKAELYLVEQNPSAAETAALQSFAIEPWNENALVLQAHALWKLKSPMKAYFTAKKSALLGAAKDKVEELADEARAAIDAQRLAHKKKSPDLKAS